MFAKIRMFVVHVLQVYRNICVKVFGAILIHYFTRDLWYYSNVSWKHNNVFSTSYETIGYRTDSFFSQ